MEFNWEKMKGSVIHCDTKGKANLLLHICKNKGWNIVGLENVWDRYETKTCFEILIDTKNVHYCDLKYYKEENREVLEFENVIVPVKPKICEILGVDTNEEFEIRTTNGNKPLAFRYYINEYGQFFNADEFNSPSVGMDTINGKFKIVKIPKYTDEQKEIFKALKVLGYNYIARDSGDVAFSYETKPEKHQYDWQSNNEVCMALETSKILNAPHLNFIQWEDEQPFEIPEV